METNCKTRTNNQVTTIQKLSNPDNIINTENGSYVWISNGNPIHNYLTAQSFSKQKESEKSNCNFHRSSLHLKNPTINKTFEEPIDLTCTNRKHYEETRNNHIKYPNTIVPLAVNVQTKKGRKRKHSNEVRVRNAYLNVAESNITEFFQIADNKKAEVLKAAKSLFSKRTRTLFHWMYPNTSKAQLKFAVASSWETLGIQEKEFYISQVLGRFGFPQANLMINPQLGSLSSFWHLSNCAETSASNASEVNEETSTAVSSLLLSEGGNFNNHLWSQPTLDTANLGTSIVNNYRKSKQNRPGRPSGVKSNHVPKEDYSLLRQIRDEPTIDEFQDDPELSNEFQQFRWALHLSNNVKSEV